MKGDKSHDTDHWVKQEQNHGAVYFEWVGSTKEGWNVHSPLSRLLINSHSKEDSLRIPLVHDCGILYLQIMLFCCSADHRLQLRLYFFIALASSTWHTMLLQIRPYLITCQHIITISPSWQGAELILSTLGVTTTAEGYGGRQFVCVFQWVSIPSERMLHHCRYRSLQTISQMLIEVIKAAASRGNRCRW